jgi:hypothetical protein
VGARELESTRGGCLLYTLPQIPPELWYLILSLVVLCYSLSSSRPLATNWTLKLWHLHRVM